VVGLLIALLYNVPIKLGGHHNKITAVYDAFVNSVTFAHLLLLTLVFTHGLSAQENSEKKEFYLLKFVMCAIVAVSLGLSLYLDELNIFAYYDLMFVQDQQVKFNAKVAYIVFSVALVAYMALLAVYLFKARNTT